MRVYGDEQYIDLFAEALRLRLQLARLEAEAHAARLHCRAQADYGGISPADTQAARAAREAVEPARAASAAAEAALSDYEVAHRRDFYTTIDLATLEVEDA